MMHTPTITVMRSEKTRTITLNNLTPFRKVARNVLNDSCANTQNAKNKIFGIVFLPAVASRWGDRGKLSLSNHLLRSDTQQCTEFFKAGDRTTHANLSITMMQINITTLPEEQQFSRIHLFQQCTAKNPSCLQNWLMWLSNGWFSSRQTDWMCEVLSLLSLFRNNGTEILQENHDESFT